MTIAGLVSLGKSLIVVEVWCFSGLGVLAISSPQPSSRIAIGLPN